jgi:hypothetical protein
MLASILDDGKLGVPEMPVLPIKSPEIHLLSLSPARLFSHEAVRPKIMQAAKKNE